MYIKRYLEKSVLKDLKQKMVFVGGPRQAGKTRMARELLKIRKQDPLKRYLNWDALEDREKIYNETFPSGKGMLVFDEIHKYSKWRQTIKGLFDKRGDELEILVTGSARLDLYRRGGDSLQGRYHFYHLFPLTLAELNKPTQSTLLDLLHYSGFPEPFLLASEKETRRWSREYQFHLIREDLRDLEQVHALDSIEKMVLRLPCLVGSPLSLNSIREDLSVSHQSVSRWMQMLERLYMIFRIYPFGAPQIRAVKKEAKHYHYDWTLVKEPGPRFENLVACHLLKWCRYIQDTEGYSMELRYFRDVDRREVDFVILKEDKPIHFIECKKRGNKINPAIKYLKLRFPKVETTQVALEGDEDLLTKDSIRVCPAAKFLQNFI